MFKGKFDTDLEALKKRTGINNNEFCLEKWIFKICPIEKQNNILELGCGLGKQTNYIINKYPSIKITAVDKSQNFLPNLEHSNLNKICKDFDEIEFEQYDLVLAVYSIYYSKDMYKLIEKLCKKTKTIVLVGPGKNNNKELTNLIKEATNKDTCNPDFINTDLLPSHQTYRTENTVLFNSTTQVLDWWKNHNTYCETTFNKIKNNFNIKQLTKQILGIVINV